MPNMNFFPKWAFERPLPKTGFGSAWETINLCKIQSSYACSNRTNKQWILNSKIFMSRRETFMGFPFLIERTILCIFYH